LLKIAWIRTGRLFFVNFAQIRPPQAHLPLSAELIGAHSDFIKFHLTFKFNEPRCAAIYLIRKLRRDCLKEIGLVFMLKKYSSVSSIIERMKSRMKNDRHLKIRIKKLEEKLKKSQEQT